MKWCFFQNSTFFQSVHITTDIPPLFINFPKNKGGDIWRKIYKRVLLIFLNCHQTNSSRSWKGPMKKIQLHGRTKTIKMLVQTAAAHFRAQLKDVIEEWNRSIWVLCFLHIQMLSSWNSIKKAFHDSFSPTFCAHKFKFYWNFHRKYALLFNLNFI